MIQNFTNDNASPIPVMLPLKEAAARSGLSYECLRQLCLKGQIVFFRSGAKFLVNYAKLVDFLNEGGAL